MSQNANGGRVRGDGRDLSLVDRLERLYVAVVADCLDKVGLRDQVLAPTIRPLDLHHRAAGYAHTVEVRTVDHAPADPADYYRKEIEAVDALQPGDVLVTSTCDGSFWGELLSTAATARGAAGIVADAQTRDVRGILDLGFPTFVTGINAQDSLGRLDVAAVDVTIQCGGVEVNAGDLILADFDGVVVIPAGVAEEVLDLAEEKVAAESTVREGLAAGESVRVLFDRTGVL